MESLILSLLLSINKSLTQQLKIVYTNNNFIDNLCNSFLPYVF